ncbi:MAG: DUF4192 domain-containing protein [Micropruina sp.]|uniref:DUF4192 domain-containing protein n=1 Tax=Micropruina sp. TaxID=2737536 RepID=UPI0039E5DD7D
MTSDTSVPVARVRDLPDLLGVIPHLLGFHPEESMVLIVIDNGRIELTARADLGDLQPANHLELMIDRMLLRWPAAGMWLVAYAAEERAGWALLRRGRKHLGDAMIGDPACVSGGRYRVGDCWGPQFDHDPRSSAAAASATLHGLQARPRRGMLAEQLRADPGQAATVEACWFRALQRAMPLDSSAWVRELLGALASALRDPAGLGPDELAWLGLLINHPQARDQAVLSLEPAAADSWVELWSRVVRACPHGTQSQPLAVLALAAWVNGNGALQTVCLEELEAQGVRPGLQDMLEDLNEGIIPPSEWDDLRVRFRDLLEEADAG